MNKGTKMTAKFAGTCGHCGEHVAAGSAIVFYRDMARNRAWHVNCARAESLRRKIWAVGLKEMAGDIDERHWREMRIKMEAELAALESGRIPA